MKKIYHICSFLLFCSLLSGPITIQARTAKRRVSKSGKLSHSTQKNSAQITEFLRHFQQILPIMRKLVVKNRDKKLTKQFKTVDHLFKKISKEMGLTSIMAQNGKLISIAARKKLLKQQKKLQSIIDKLKPGIKKLKPAKRNPKNATYRKYLDQEKKMLELKKNLIYGEIFKAVKALKKKKQNKKLQKKLSDLRSRLKLLDSGHNKLLNH